MNTMENIKKLIDEINSRKPKNYEQMKIEKISKELHKVMEFEQNVLKKIEMFEKEHQDPDLIKYTKMICRNTIERETMLIQEIYLKKIDSQYLNSKLNYSSSS
jgi:hypothetical protein